MTRRADKVMQLLISARLPHKPSRAGPNQRLEGAATFSSLSRCSHCRRATAGDSELNRMQGALLPLVAVRFLDRFTSSLKVFQECIEAAHRPAALNGAESHKTTLCSINSPWRSDEESRRASSARTWRGGCPPENGWAIRKKASEGA